MGQKRQGWLGLGRLACVLHVVADPRESKMMNPCIMDSCVKDTPAGDSWRGLHFRFLEAGALPGRIGQKRKKRNLCARLQTCNI